MNYYRIASDQGEGCITASDSDAAIAYAINFLDRTNVRVLHTTPYPTHPKLNPGDGCPSFCFNKPECKNRSACPRDYSCTE